MGASRIEKASRGRCASIVFNGDACGGVEEKEEQQVVDLVVAAGGCMMKAPREDQEIIEWFEEVAENAGAVQRETLRRIIELNHGTEYLRKWLGDDFSPNDLDLRQLEAIYKSLVPLSSHEDMEPLIQRIADGDTSPVITQQPITTLSLSSGTTDGRPKYVPFTRFSAQSTLQIFRLAAAHRARVLPIRDGGMILEFIYSSKQLQSKGGLNVGTATTHYYASEEFKIKQRSTESFTCSPEEVISGGDYKQSTYCHLLLGLHYSEQVEFVTSTFAYSIVQAFRALEEQWEELVEDLRTGRLNPARVTSPRMRRAVLEVISSPDPALAAKVEGRCRELQKGSTGYWSRAIPVLWPNAKYVYSIMTGSMLPYLSKLRHYAGELPLVGAEYGSTESWIGVNLDPCCPPERVTFTVVPTFSYFEFIPLYYRRQHHHHHHHHQEELDEVNNGCCCRGNNTACSADVGEQQLLTRRACCGCMTLPVPVMSAASASACDDDFVEAEPVPLSGVKVGQQYELVLTTFTGLYRYRLGDVVEVAGFYRGTPRLNFVCRRKLILTVNIDKNTERDLQLAVEAGSRLLTSRSSAAAELVDFTSHAVVVVEAEQVGPAAGHYAIYWEIRGDAEEDVLSECCREMDLAFADYGYVVSRRSGTIGPLELRVVERGAFRKVLDYYIGNGAAMSQFKTPRCTSNQSLLRILDLCTLRSFRSTAYAHHHA